MTQAGLVREVLFKNNNSFKMKAPAYNSREDYE